MPGSRALMRRREFLAAGLGGGGLALVAGGTARAETPPDNPWAKLTGDFGTVRPPTFSRPLPVPRIKRPTRTDGPADEIDLVVRAASGQPLPGALTAVLGFDGLWPGPTIVATRGRPIWLTVTNQLSEPVNIHNHGHHVAASSDGHPLDIIKPGASRLYKYPNNQPAGTYWYHDHTFGLTGPHVYRGLAGIYLIRDPADEALGLPAGEYDVPVLIQDRVFDADNGFAYDVNAGSVFTGVLGNTLCANGVHTPFLSVATRRYRFRFINAANSRNLRLALGNGAPLVQIASDGRMLEAPVVAESVALAPAERVDVVIDFGGAKPGDAIVLRNLDATWPELPDVMRFQVARREADPSRVPERLADVPRVPEAEATKHRRIRFQLADGKWTMNGLRFDPARIDFRPRLGTTELWEIENGEQTQTHPFHHHLVPFQILDINGAPPPPALRGWKDTVSIPPAGRARVIIRFYGFTGTYVFHCHKLEHEDHAMMLQEQVVG
jgi:FtsP/CotA-like multicopper oxidase with cupredoxin domain